ncbi:unnamed protein product [Lupinus luteus]|uniref:Uncharacterized protein n=1 Tax=Lupinus luteus TaxID=3873 RepID=A0AAV1WAU5_LUPLU
MLEEIPKNRDGIQRPTSISTLPLYCISFLASGSTTCLNVINIKLSKKKKSLEFELDTKNQAKEKYADRVEPESSLSNQEKDIEDDSAESDKTNNRDIKKKKYKNKIEKELNLLLRKYLSFQLSSLNMSLNSFETKFVLI